MAYEPPTYQEFITRFPIFAGDQYSQPVVEAILVEASRGADNSWLEPDYKPAVMYLAAHLLANDNSGEGEDVTFGASQSTNISGESFGGMSISYASPAAGGANASATYGNTEYGRRYLRLLRLNKPGVVVA